VTGDHDPILDALEYGSQCHQQVAEIGADAGAATAVHLTLIIIADQDPESLWHQLQLKVVLRLHLIRHGRDETG
jgi:hypothetical protein